MMDFGKDWICPLVRDVLNRSLGKDVPYRSRSDRNALVETEDDGCNFRVSLNCKRNVQVTKVCPRAFTGVL